MRLLLAAFAIFLFCGCDKPIHEARALRPPLTANLYPAS